MRSTSATAKTRSAAASRMLGRRRGVPDVVCGLATRDSHAQAAAAAGASSSAASKAVASVVTSGCCRASSARSMLVLIMA